jgi:hypothetical protein
MMNEPLLTAAEFCARNRISRTHLFELDRAGEGPRRIKIGRREYRISVEAERDWRKSREVVSAPAE